MTVDTAVGQSGDATRTSAPLLSARGLSAGYNGVRVVRDLDLEVNAGEVVALIGANGAGKTTTLLSLAGELPALAGEVSWQGSTARLSLHKRARRGLALVTEERSVIMGLTGRQNVSIGRGCDRDRVVTLFPELERVLNRRAGLLSGGEQQMLTLARALSRPTTTLLADELSLGLAPKIVGRLLRQVRLAADRGMGALLVEQHVHRVLEIADRVYVLRRGAVVMTLTAAEARSRLTEIQSAYLTG